MARYELRYGAGIVKDLRGIPKADVRRILAKAGSLCDDPRPTGSQKLAGAERYRLRQGNYRILYSIDDQRVLVEVVKIGHRKDVYRSS